MNFREKINRLIQFLPSWKKLGLALSALFLLSFCVKFFSFAGDKNTIVAAEEVAGSMRAFAINLPKDLNFAGEKVPQSDFSVRESIDREFLTSAYWQSSMILLIKRSARWFPVIEPILKRNGVPDDIKYIALAESHLTNSISPRSAVGFWQLIAPTAINYGLEVNDEVDERYSVEKSTEAACKYFKDAYRKFGNWTLAAASYNLGMGGIEVQLKKQKVNSYYDLYLNEETGRYVYRVIALKCIVENPQLFGIGVRKKDLYHQVPTVAVKVDSTVRDLVDFAISQGYNFKILKIFNPWLRKSQLMNPNKKQYLILFPKKEYIDKGFDDIENEVLKEGLKPDSAAITNSVDTAGGKKKNAGVIHQVTEHDSWESLARKYNVTKEQIIMWNMLDDNAAPEKGMEVVVFPGSGEEGKNKPAKVKKEK